MRSTLMSAAAGLAACWGTAAAAQPVPETVVTGEIEQARLRNGEERVSAVVRYADLDLASQAGVDALHGRVHRAATRICVDPNLQPLTFRQAGLDCRDDAIASAQDQVAAAIAGYGNPNRLAAAALVIRVRR